MKELLKENYKVENYLIKSSRKRKIYDGNNMRGFSEISVLEDEISVKDKLIIFDSHTDGLGSYLLELIDRWIRDRQDENIVKRTKYDSLHHRSVEKWVKNNDPINALRVAWDKNYPTYWLFGCEFRMTKETPRTDYGHSMMYDGQNVIHQWFHLLLSSLEIEETKHFKENDPYQVKINEVKELFNYIKDTDVKVDQDLVDIYYNGKRDEIAEEKLDKYISILNDIRNYVNEKVNQLKED